MYITGPHQSLVNIGSGSGLVLSAITWATKNALQNTHEDLNIDKSVLLL